jgi:hypothetical protein
LAGGGKCGLQRAGRGGWTDPRIPSFVEGWNLIERWQDVLFGDGLNHPREMDDILLILAPIGKALRGDLITR